jgi:beta-glucanase (GH16 family)
LTYPWTSGVVTTQDHVDFTYGYVQVVAQIPKGDGFWPALWLLPQNGEWPPEIDIMENFGNDTSNVYLTNHPVGAPQQELIVNTGTDLSTGYHTFAVDWEPGAITWYVDGQAKYTVTSGVPNMPMYFIANLAIDGTPGRANPDASTPSSASLDIKSVEIWQHETSP